jgi:ABC-type microcin C transport system duplicated ATPase subunit YejF
VVLDGRVVERGSAGGILRAPQHGYTQTLITAFSRVSAA